MKRKLSLVLALTMALCLAACSSDSGESVSQAVTETSSVSAVVEESAVSAEESAAESKEESAAESSEESKEESTAESKEESKEESAAESKEESKEESKAEDKEASADGRYVYQGISMKIPEGFAEPDESGSVVIVYTENYPEDADNINLTSTNESVSIYTEENVNKTLETVMGANNVCRNYKKYQVDGYDVVTYDIDITVDDVTITQTQYAYFLNDSTSLIAFTDVSGKYTAAVKAMIDDIKIVE